MTIVNTQFDAKPKVQSFGLSPPFGLALNKKR